MVQCVAACCSVLRCVAVCCSVLQCVASCIAPIFESYVRISCIRRGYVTRDMVQCVAV